MPLTLDLCFALWAFFLKVTKSSGRSRLKENWNIGCCDQLILEVENSTSLASNEQKMMGNMCSAALKPLVLNIRFLRTTET